MPSKRIRKTKSHEKKMYSKEEVIRFFIEGYKQRAEASGLIFDEVSRLYAIKLFNQINKTTV